MTATRLKLGISTCPNDTFAFHGIMTGQVRSPHVEFEIELMDVQELNERLFTGAFDVAKASFHAALLLSQTYGVLPAGSALGFGVGPLLLASQADTTPNASSVVLCPGLHTTAHLLYRTFYPQAAPAQQVLFSDIMPALQNGHADFGVCIHEGRFTYQEHGLALVEDLGTRWEQSTGRPLPLGGILCRLNLPGHIIQIVGRMIADSIAYGHAHREETLQTMRPFANEFADEVLFSHVDLYVNQWTSDLGETGRQALDYLHEQARTSGVISADQPPLVFL